MKRLPKNVILLAVLISAAVAFRLLYLWQFRESPLFNTPIGPDVEEYDNWAKEILAWGFNSGKVHIHAPLYPFLLAALYWLFSFKIFFVRLFQMLLVFGGFGILAWTIKKIIAPKKQLIMWIFLSLAAFYPVLLFYSAELISETLILPLLCLTITLLYCGEDQLQSGAHRKGILLICGAGVCAGLAAITHPTSLLFIVLEIFLLVFFTKTKLRFRLLTPVLFGLMALLVIAPLCIRNSMIAKRFVLIQKNSGFNFYLGNNPNATGTCYIRPGKEWRRIHDWADAGSAQRGVSKDKFLIYMSLKFIHSSPLKELKLLTQKALYVWNRKELPSGADSAPILYFTPIVQSGRYLFILLGSLCICGILLVACKRETLLKYRHFLILLLAYWAAQTITTTSGRYRLAMYPAFFIFAAFALDYIIHNIRDRKSLAKFAIALSCGILIVTVPSPPVYPHVYQAETDSLYAEAYFQQSKYSEAAKYLHSCLEFDPMDARAYNLLGICTEPVSPAQAAQYYQLAIKSDPKEPEGYLNLAIQYSNRGMFTESEKYFADALSRGPHSVPVLYNYACFMLKKKNLVSAEEYLRKCLTEAPWHDKALNTLGVILLQKKEAQAALKYLRSAHRMVPRKTGVMLNLAVALYQNGKRGKALDMLNKVIELEPDNKAANFLINKWK